MLLVSTRKGLFVLEADGADWRIARTCFLGDHVNLAMADPRDGSWYVALDLGHFGCKLQRSTDHGVSWRECAVPAYPEGAMANVGDGKPSQPATLKLVWALAPGGPSEAGRLWAGTIPGGLFRSDDQGGSWQLVRSLWEHVERGDWFGGGYDWPGIHSVCVDPRDPRCVRIAVSTGGVWRSDDAGDTWRQTADGMRAEYMPPDRAFDPGVQDVHRMVQCAGQPRAFWAQHHNGIFRSTADGGDWQEIPEAGPAVFGFAVAVHPADPDTAWFVPATKDEKRYPVGGELVVTRTRDGGRSFDVLRAGLPAEPAYDLVYRHSLAIDDSGDRLAFGSTTGGLWTTADQGDTWRMLPARLPPVLAVTYA